MQDGRKTANKRGDGVRLRVLKNYIKKASLYLAGISNYKFILNDWVSLGDINALQKVLDTKRFSRNLKPLTVSLPADKRILVLAPHPDDDIFSSGGTLLKSLRRRSVVKTIYLTTGETSASKRIDDVERESKEVSMAAGTEIVFWKFPSRGIRIDAESTERLTSAYKEFRPNVIFLPFLTDDHDDHRRAVQLFYEAFKGFADIDSDVWAYQVYSSNIPNVVVDITDVIDEKTELMKRWKSKTTSRDWPHYIRGMNAFNSRFLETNSPCYAETFFVVPAKEYVELCSIYFEHPVRDLYYSEYYRKG